MPNIPSVLLVDGYSLIHRGFHALPLLSSEDGVYTNAVQGFFNMLFKAIADYRPDGLCVMLDMHAPTFRHTMYDEYKAGRKPTPEELRPQFAIVREILSAMGVRQCELEGYEADDLLGTASKLLSEQGIKAYVLTGDRDSLQLVGGNTQVILTKTGITESLLLDADKVKEIYGYTPEQVPDMKGLMGDSSDNIPGVPGVGEKTALKLIQEYGTLENTLSHAGEIKGKLGEKLRDFKEQAELSKDLGTIRRSAPMTLSLADCPITGMTNGKAALEKYRLKRLSQQLDNLFSVKPQKLESEKIYQQAVKAAPEKARELPALPEMDDRGLLQTREEIEKFTSSLDENAPVALCIGESLTLCLENGSQWTVPLARDMLGGGMYEDQAIKALAPLLKQNALTVHGAKALWHELSRLGASLPEVEMDTLIGAYLLDPGQKDFTLSGALAKTGLTLTPDAYGVMCLARCQRSALEADGMMELMQTIEQPLTRVLFEMEKEGFQVDKAVLSELGAAFTKELEDCREQVYRLTGVNGFNLQSPKQLGEVLFDKLGLPAKKKGKTGTYSTDAEVLEELQALHPAIEPLLRYRKLSKLMGTYVDGLKPLIDAGGRVHTTFDQTATVTGRISSLEPNLQNIPVRTQQGREIRKAFVTKDGYVLVDADYSQIELRVLAHLSGDPAMIDAFQKGQDIHQRTAAEIAGVAMDQVTPDMRSRAKATNFGVVYGISSFGLARNAGISRKEAQDFIDRYFERYPKVKQFMDQCVRLGYERGYTQTLFGRRRELPELQSPNRNVRNFGERAAMNTPVQGTAADIIKLAMVRARKALMDEGLKGRLILQVHDELIIESPIDECEKTQALLRRVMEGVCELSVPLCSEVSSAKNWYEAK